MNDSKGKQLGRRLAAVKLMGLGLIGTIIGFSAVIEILKLNGVDLPSPALWVILGVGLPLYVLYLWQHRSTDNKRFILK
jgi:hypothetical protein